MGQAESVQCATSSSDDVVQFSTSSTDAPSTSAGDNKDTVVFLSEREDSLPISNPNVKALLSFDADDEPEGFVDKSTGDINWSCPCVASVISGPCGYEFRGAFECFTNSEASPKGSDCYEFFDTMSSCMSQYPTLYGKRTDADDAMTASLDMAAPDDASPAAVESGAVAKKEKS